MKEESFDEIVAETRAFWKRPLYITAFILSGLWVWAAVDYFISVGWWTTRYRLSPAEFVGFVSSQILPLALIWFVVAWVDRRHQLERESRQLRAYMSQLFIPSEEGARYTQTLTDALKEQIAQFRDVFERVADQTSSVRDQMRQWIKDLAVVIDHVDTKTVKAMEDMAHHVQSLAQSTEKANESTATITHNLASRAELLQVTSDKVSRQMGTVAGILNENMAHIDHLSDEMLKITDKTHQIVDSMDASAEAFEKHIDKMDGLLIQYSQQTDTGNAKLFENAEKILTILKTQGSLLDQEIEKILHKVDNAQKSMIEQSNYLSDVANEAAGQVSKVGAGLTAQAELLSRAVTDTEGALKELIAVGAKEEAAHLLDVSKKTEKFVNDLKNDLASLQTDQFMNDARLILEHLATFSIDIVHVFTPKAEEEQWKKYYAGDNAAFMRYLMTALPKEKMDDFKKLYQENSTLRVAVTRYMAEFDVLAVKAKNNEKKDVLLPVLIGSDAGRLYMILKQALSKKGDLS